MVSFAVIPGEVLDDDEMTALSLQMKADKKPAFNSVCLPSVPVKRGGGGDGESVMGGEASTVLVLVRASVSI